MFFRFNVLLSCQHEGQMFSTLPFRVVRRFKDLKIKTLKLLNKERPDGVGPGGGETRGLGEWIESPLQMFG